MPPEAFGCGCPFLRWVIAAIVEVHRHHSLDGRPGAAAGQFRVVVRGVEERGHAVVIPLHRRSPDARPSYLGGLALGQRPPQVLLGRQRHLTRGRAHLTRGDSVGDEAPPEKSLAISGNPSRIASITNLVCVTLRPCVHWRPTSHVPSPWLGVGWCTPRRKSRGAPGPTSHKKAARVRFDQQVFSWLFDLAGKGFP